MGTREPLLPFFVLRCNYIPPGGIVNIKSSKGLTFASSGLPEAPSAGQCAALTRRGSLIGASLPPPHPEPSPRMLALEIRRVYRRQRPTSGASLILAFPSALDAPTAPRTPLAVPPRPTRSRPRPVLPPLGRLPRHKGGAVVAIARAVRRRMARSARRA